jgi:hypothetical protein
VAGLRSAHSDQLEELAADPRPAACRTCKDLHKENWLPVLAAHLLEQAETRPITRNLDDVETYSEIAIYPRNQGDAPWPTTSR